MLCPLIFFVEKRFKVRANEFKFRLDVVVKCAGSNAESIPFFPRELKLMDKSSANARLVNCLPVVGLLIPAHYNFTPSGRNADPTSAHGELWDCEYYVARECM